MTEQSRKQKGTGAPARSDLANNTSAMEQDAAASRATGRDSQEAPDDLLIGPGVYQPTVSIKPNNAFNSWEPEYGRPNGFVDSPDADGNSMGDRADAKRDASPNRRPKVVDADSSGDTQ